VELGGGPEGNATQRNYRERAWPLRSRAFAALGAACGEARTLSSLIATLPFYWLDFLNARSGPPLHGPWCALPPHAGWPLLRDNVAELVDKEDLT
jgi:hypothetical protein